MPNKYTKKECHRITSPTLLKWIMNIERKNNLYQYGGYSLLENALLKELVACINHLLF